MTAGLAAEVREQIRLALRIADVSQAELCRRLGLSEKHVSQMLTGRAPISLDMAERMLGEIKWELEVAAVPMRRFKRKTLAAKEMAQASDDAHGGQEKTAGLSVQCTAHGDPVAMVREGTLWRCPRWVADGELRGHVRWISDDDVAEIARGGRGRYRGVLVTLPDAPGSAVPAQE